MFKRLALAILLLLPLQALAIGGFRYSGENLVLAATTTSSSVTFTLASSKNAPNVIVYNAAAAPAVVNCGTSSVTAAAPAAGVNGGVIIPPGTQYELYIGIATTCAGILTTGTGNIYFSDGTDLSD